MKIALTSDWHIHNYSGNQVTTLEDGCNSRLRDILNCANWIVDTALAKDCTRLIHGGDITHNRRYMHVNALATAFTALRMMHKRLPFDVLEGNHDLDQSGNGSTVEALEGIVNTHCKAEVTNLGGLKVGWLPYTDDPAYVRKETARLAKAGAKVLIAHLGIGDPKFADCIPVDYETPGHVNVSDMNADLFQHVFIGHYHTAQELLPNMRYIGSPLQLNFKEAGIVKGFWIFDTESKTEPEFIENTVSPKYHKLEENEAIARLAHNEIPETDFVWVTNATDDWADEEANRDRKIPIRVDKAPKKQIETRLSKEAVTDRDKIGEYTRIMDTTLDDAEAIALTDLGCSLVAEADDELARK